MRVVLTGGWGYGNLGDDAILVSTIENVKSVFPDCIIDVLTYNLSDSAIHACSFVRLHKSVHAYVDLTSSECGFKKIDKDYSFYSKAWLKVIYLIANSHFWCNIDNFNRLGKPAIEVIKGADLLVVASGGYFTEKWTSSAIAHLAEMRAAIEFRVPFCVAGTSIGTSSKLGIRNFIMQTFQKAAAIYVRDIFSLEQLKQENIGAKLIPDIAFSRWRENCPVVTKDRKIIVGLIITNRDHCFQKKMTAALGNFLSGYTNNSVKIVMSRRWKQDLAASFAVQKKLGRLNIRSEIIIPESFQAIEAEFVQCDIVISQNLHGLILAARNLIPIVVVNDYPEGSPNYRKLFSFTDQIGYQGLVVDRKTSEKDICFTICNSYATKIAFANRAGYLREIVKKDTAEFFIDLKRIL